MPSNLQPPLKSAHEAIMSGLLRGLAVAGLVLLIVNLRMTVSAE
jgi:hypothetical protein